MKNKETLFTLDMDNEKPNQDELNKISKPPLTSSHRDNTQQYCKPKIVARGVVSINNIPKKEIEQFKILAKRKRMTQRGLFQYLLNKELSK